MRALRTRARRAQVGEATEGDLCLAVPLMMLLEVSENDKVRINARVTTFADLEGSCMNEGGCEVLYALSIGWDAPAVVQLAIAADKLVAYQVH